MVSFNVWLERKIFIMNMVVMMMIIIILLLLFEMALLHSRPQSHSAWFVTNTSFQDHVIKKRRALGTRMALLRIALMHVYVTQANFTTKPRFEIKNKRSFTEMNSQGSRVEKNTHAQKVQMQKILFTNEACWWNLLVWRNHA